MHDATRSSDDVARVVTDYTPASKPGLIRSIAQVIDTMYLQALRREPR